MEFPNLKSTHKHLIHDDLIFKSSYNNVKLIKRFLDKILMVGIDGKKLIFSVIEKDIIVSKEYVYEHHLTYSQELSIIVEPSLVNPLNTISNNTIGIITFDHESKLLQGIICFGETIECSTTVLRKTLTFGVNKIIMGNEKANFLFSRENSMIYSLGPGLNIDNTTLGFDGDTPTTVTYFEKVWYSIIANRTKLVSNVYITDKETQQLKLRPIRLMIVGDLLVGLHNTPDNLYLFRLIRAQNTIYTIVVRKTEEILSRINTYQFRKVSGPVGSVFEWGKFLIFNSKSDIVMFSVPTSPRTMRDENRVIKYKELSFINRTTISGDEEILTVIAPSDNSKGNLRAIISNKQSGSIYCMDLESSALTLQCPRATSEKLAGLSYSITIAYLNGSKTDFVVKFYEGDAGFNSLLIGILGFIVVALLALSAFIGCNIAKVNNMKRELNKNKAKLIKYSKSLVAQEQEEELRLDIHMSDESSIME